jgi:hypothetical protein
MEQQPQSGQEIITIAELINRIKVFHNTLAEADTNRILLGNAAAAIVQLSQRLHTAESELEKYRKPSNLIVLPSRES